MHPPAGVVYYWPGGVRRIRPIPWPRANEQVNPCRLKKVTNVRSVLADETVKLAPPVRMGTEELIAYMGDDEMLEVTPKAIRLRKAALDAGERQRLRRSKKASSSK